MNLPSGNFKWINNPNYFMNPKVWKNLTPEDPTGFWLEVTVEIPRKLHSSVAFNTFPPLPETKVLKYSDLSPTAKKLLKRKLGKSAARRYKSTKLISNLGLKRRYKTHYMILKQAIELGCRLKKVHRVISFTQVCL